MVKFPRGVFVFGKFGKIVTVDNGGVRVKHFILVPAPFFTFVPFRVFGQPLGVPSDAVTADIVKHDVFNKADIRVNTVNGNLLIVPLSVTVLDRYRNLYQLTVILGQIGIKTS